MAMRRVSTVTVLSIAGVLVAAGSAAALNSAVLGASGPRPEGAASSFVTLDEQPEASPTPSAPSATPSASRRDRQDATPGTDDGSGPVVAEVSSTRSPSDDRSAEASSSASTRGSSARPSSRRGEDSTRTPRPSTSRTSGRDDSRDDSGRGGRGGSGSGSGGSGGSDSSGGSGGSRGGHGGSDDDGPDDD